LIQKTLGEWQQAVVYVYKTSIPSK
jgi:hypothetical protein